MGDPTVVNTGKKIILLPSIAMLPEIKKDMKIKMKNEDFWFCAHSAYQRVLAGIHFK